MAGEYEYSLMRAVAWASPAPGQSSMSEVPSSHSQSHTSSVASANIYSSSQCLRAISPDPSTTWVQCPAFQLVHLTHVQALYSRRTQFQLLELPTVLRCFKKSELDQTLPTVQLMKDQNFANPALVLPRCFLPCVSFGSWLPSMK